MLGGEEGGSKRQKSLQVAAVRRLAAAWVFGCWVGQLLVRVCAGSGAAQLRWELLVWKIKEQVGFGAREIKIAPRCGQVLISVWK